MSDSLYWEFRQVLAELEMLPHGTITNYHSSGGGEADTREPTGESSPPHLLWKREWEIAERRGDKNRLHEVHRLATADLDSYRRSTGTGLQAGAVETELEFEDRIIRIGKGWTVEQVAIHCRCTPTFVRRARLKGGVKVDDGTEPEGFELGDSPAEKVRKLDKNGLSERGIEMATGLPKSRIRRLLGKAA